MANDEEYFSYLSKRSKLADFYRKFILYPALSKELSGKIIDVGCGIGDFLAYRKNSVGVDINEYNVNFCKLRNLEAYTIGNGKYPFEDATFDGAILDNVLEHLVDVKPTLSEIYRIIKQNGELIIGVPGKKGYTMDDDHKNFYEEKEMEKLLADYNFKIVKYIYMPFFIKSDLLSSKISQYCIYGVFKKL